MANRYGVFGTSLTLRQVNSIMKKTQELHKKVGENVPPDFVQIRYCEEADKWSVTENYNDPKNKGKFKKSNHKDYDNLNDYVFPDNFFSGTVWINMMEHPFEEFIVFQMAEFRAEYGLMNKAFSVEILDECDGMNHAFNINIYE